MSTTFKYYNKEYDLSSVFKMKLSDKIGEFLPISVHEVTKLSAKYIEGEYVQKEEFSSTIDFIEMNLDEIVQPLIVKMDLPVLEVKSLLYRALYLAFSAFYKEALVNLRGALELTLLISYYQGEDAISQDDIDAMISSYKNKIVEISSWLKSDIDTPFKSKIMRILMKQKSFNDLDRDTKWKNDIDGIYKKLSDITHSKGLINTNYHLNSGYQSIEMPPYFKKESLKMFVDILVRTVQQIAIIAVASRPLLIDVEFAYQVEIQTQEPAFGCWGDKAISIFYKLIPKKYKEYFQEKGCS